MKIMPKPLIFIALLMATCFFSPSAFAFDHSHADWERLLKKHVVLINNGNATQVRYSGFHKDRAKLKNYLDNLSSVSHTEFKSWSKNKQLSFLINAYNAFTIELILTRYPDIESIWDTGSLIVKPWRKKFITLLGQKRHLDNIEHNMIRKKGVYDDFRIHFAVNCASIGCPALRNEAFIYNKLNTQLDDSMIRFLSDKSRNRFDPKTNTLEVSKIFNWYKKDFVKKNGHHNSLASFFVKYAHLFTQDPADLENIQKMKAKIAFREYDWNLNDVEK
jgi:hypothetical protein